MRNINQKYKRQKNKSRYIIVLRNTFQQKCQYAKSFQRKKMSNSNSSSEDEGNLNSSEGLHDTEVGIGDDVLTTSHLLLSILFRRRWRWLTWTPALMMATAQPASAAATAQALRRFSSFSSKKTSIKAKVKKTSITMPNSQLVHDNFSLIIRMRRWVCCLTGPCPLRRPPSPTHRLPSSELLFHETCHLYVVRL